MWSVDESAINVEWHVHHPLLLPDWNNDGIPDLLVSHGGEMHHSTDHDVRQYSLTFLCDNHAVYGRLNTVLKVFASSKNTSNTQVCLLTKQIF